MALQNNVTVDPVADQIPGWNQAGMTELIWVWLDHLGDNNNRCHIHPEQAFASGHSHG